MSYFSEEFRKSYLDRSPDLWSDDETADYYANLDGDEEQELNLGEER